LNSALDRMLHLTACAKSLSPGVISVAGGPAVRALPLFSAARFDFACLGDVEELRSIASMLWGEDFVAPPGDLFPRQDLADRRGRIGYVEASRYCNFRCSFCSLTGEGRRFRTYDVDHVRRQIEATGKRLILFLDNNFYGSDRRNFSDRLDMLTDLRRRGTIDGWSALVTGDFFAKQSNLDRARESGCVSLFSGVESFDAATLAAYNKKQNSVVPQIEMIRNCLESGIMFQYGIMLDPSSRRIRDLEAEIDFILSRDDLSLPSYFTLPIPLIGTPYFYDALAAGIVRPNIHLREMNGVTLQLTPLDPTPDVLRFAERLTDLRGRRAQVAHHTVRFMRRYGRRFSWVQNAIVVANAALTTLPGVASSPFRPHLASVPADLSGPPDRWDPAYRPPVEIHPDFAGHYRPTRVIDEEGAIDAALAADLARQIDRVPARMAAAC